MTPFWQHQPVLITGVSGFLGGHISKLLIENGADVVGTIHDIKQTSYIQLSGLDKQMTICHADIVDFHRMREIISDYEIKYIFHCAADSIVRKCARDPVSCFNVNIMGTVSVLEAARAVGTVESIICMESDKAYGACDPKELPYKEDQPINPRNVYEVSKACAGLIAQAYEHNYELPVFRVRSANLYGPGDMNLSRIVPQSIVRILRGQSPVLYRGVGDYIREFIYVEDAAAAIVRLMGKIDTTKSHVINLGSGEKQRVEDMVGLLCEALGSQLKPQIVSKDPIFKEIPEQYLDLTKLRGFLPDFDPRPLSQGLPKTVAWYREFHKKGMLV